MLLNIFSNKSQLQNPNQKLLNPCEICLKILQGGLSSVDPREGGHQGRSPLLGPISLILIPNNRLAPRLREILDTPLVIIKQNVCIESYLPPANEVWEGYVFTCVCHSVHWEGVCLSACWDTTNPPPSETRHPPGSRHPPGTRHPLGADTPPLGPGIPPQQCRLGDTVYERAVCILMECNLVDQFKHAIEMYWYRSGTVNLKSFVGKVLLRIKWKFELTVYFKHGILGKL